MKKLLTLMIFVSFVVASCQKEETAQPETKALKTVSEKKDLSGWD